ncbi:MAG: hypothetical protein H2045_05405 [Rhizobiales bacterium]|nr:hypothetical protein [Hyphomicrobiales bacterium]
MKRFDRMPLLPYLVLFAVWLVLSKPWFIDGLVIPYDAKNHFYAMVRFVAHAWHSGESVAWSPFHYGGFPMIADPQSTIFTPSLWLPALLSEAPSMHLVDMTQALHLLVMGVSVIAFGIGRKWHPLAALLAGMTAMMSGVVMIRLEHVLMIVSMMWLSVALWRLDAALRCGGLWRGILFGLALGMMLIDRDHVAYLGAWFLFLYWISKVITTRGTTPPMALARQQLPVVAGGIVALVLAAVPVLLLLQLANDSNRPNFGYEEAAFQSVHPAALASFFMPEFYGDLVTDDAYWGPASHKWGGPELFMTRGMMHLYFGALPLALIFWHGVLGRRLFIAGNRFFTATAAFMLIYALGRYTPVFELLYHAVPGVDLFRRPADGLFMAGFAVSLMSGALLNDRLNAAPATSSVFSRVLTAAIPALALGLIGLVAIEHQRIDFFLSSLGRLALYAALIIGLLVAARRYRAQAPLILGALFLTVSADLLHTGSGIKGNARPAEAYLPQAEPMHYAVFSRLNALLATKDASGVAYRQETIGLGPVVQNVAQVARFQGLLGYNPLRLRAFDVHIGPRMQNNAAPERFFGDRMTGYDSATTNQLGVKYIVTGVPIEKLDPTVPEGRFLLRETLTFGQLTAYIYENPQAEARAIVVGEADNARKGNAIVTRYGNAEIRVTVESPAAGRLILRDFYYPGWQATVNGVSTPVVRYDDMFRSVAVPAGKSEIVMTFDLLTRHNLKTFLNSLGKPA